MRRSGPNMRLTHQRMGGHYDSTPESVLDWLEEQLECRGIDAVVYTRYILSLLQDYNSDEELTVDGMPSMTRRSLKRHNSYTTIASVKENLKPVTTQKFKHKRYLNTSNSIDVCPDADYCPTDEQRKLAVVQCLKSASEQEFGIESFVDELCAKLKNIKLQSEDSDLSVDTTVETTNTSAKISPKEQAMKYYAAFPALDHNSNEAKSIPSKSCVGIVLTNDFNRNSVDTNRWNGQKITEFITNNQSEEADRDITDTEVDKLVICSDKCPNNADHKVEDTISRLHLRPISTSFGELASFMGPFADNDLLSDDYKNLMADTPEPIPINENNMRDKSTNTETHINTKTKLSSIVETSAESEPEYQDLCDMINEVLRNGISEEDSPLGSVGLVHCGTDRKKRLSWNCYLDTYECPVGTSETFSHSPVNPLSDEVLAEELLYSDNTQVDDCSQYEEVFDDYFLEDRIGYVSDEHRVYDIAGYPINEDVPSFGPQLGLHVKRRHIDAVKKIRKPCTYFIEGNCKRSVCKYSHDISAITCKYWEEGFCFKAELCPFLHGYADEGTRSSGPPLSTSALNTYVIESESDFPALSTNGLSEESACFWYGPEPVLDMEQHLLEMKAQSMAKQQQTHSHSGPSVPLSKAKLPIAVFMKKKVKKRKDRNLQ